MTARLRDKRIEFYLEHRDDIREWAAIEKDVARAVRSLLSESQADLEVRLRELDSAATTTRLDNGKYERIMLRRSSWPVELGVTLEWEKTVDPFGGSLPKIGVFFVTKAPGESRLREAVLERCRQTGGLAALGYKIGPESVWPAMRRVEKSRDWWRDPDQWVGDITSDVIALWEKAAPAVEAALGAATEQSPGP